MARIVDHLPVEELYRTRLSGHLVELCGAPEGHVEPCGTCVERAAVAVLLDQPLGIVAGGEGANGVADLIDGLENAAVDGLFFQYPSEKFMNAPSALP